MEKSKIEIVIVEDEEDILELLEYYLTKEGYSVTGFLSTQRVAQFLEEENPALMIIDRNLPGVEGSEFVSDIRAKGCTIPVIFVTARDKESDVIEGFNAGADDYVTKPFSGKEMVLRVNSLLKRSGLKTDNIMKYKDLILNIQKRELKIESVIIPLTNLEFKLLLTFVKNPNQSLERDFLRDEVWGGNSNNFHSKTINVAMNRLKKKIDPTGDKKYFLPVWGVGYKLS